MPKPAAKSFRATLERMDSPLKWVIVRIPFDVHKLWGKRGQLRIKGEINGLAFRTSLFPTGKGGHYLLVNKRMQAGGRTGPGMAAHFWLEPDTEKRVVAEPDELTRALAEDRGLRRWFDKLNPSKRSEIVKLVAQPKSSAGATILRVPMPAARIDVSSLSCAIRLKPVAVPTSTDIGSVNIRIPGKRLSDTSSASLRGASDEPSTSANFVLCCMSRITERTASARNM